MEGTSLYTQVSRSLGSSNSKCSIILYSFSQVKKDMAGHVWYHYSQYEVRKLIITRFSWVPHMPFDKLFIYPFLILQLSFYQGYWN